MLYLLKKITPLRNVVILVIIALLFAGCATVAYTPSHYSNLGYTPYSATGIASTYGNGDGFNGHRMANGQRFNKNNPHIAASPSLPLGTKLKVTNLENGRTIYVEITDRMGHIKHRIIDLSYAAARRLHIRDLAYVHIQSVSNAVFRKHLHN